MKKSCKAGVYLDDETARDLADLCAVLDVSVSKFFENIAREKIEQNREKISRLRKLRNETV